MSKRRVSYYYDPDVGAYTYGYGHLMKPQRMRITHELVSTYGMLDKMHVLRAKRASAESMTRFHTDEYIEFLAKVNPENVEELVAQRARFLVLGDDNPAFEGIFEFCSISAGGSIAAAERLTNGAADIAINWAGGLHHAKKREASGFCYINDIVLCILELLRSVPRVLYIDIDCHHGDGVEEAFYTTDRVLTCSFHKFGEFFPGTGTLEDRGRGKGKGYAVNVPLKDGVTDKSFRSIFEPVVDKIIEVFQPSAIVLQCGADSLAGDRLGCLNLSMEGHANCIKYVRSRNIPLVLLGGGGYTVKNVVRAWTYETACALGIENEIDRNMPWNDYFEWFGPRYRLEVLPNNMEDMNVKEGTLDQIKTTVLQYLQELQPAPSVGLQDVPRESLGEILGFGNANDEKQMDDLDERLAQHSRFVYGLQEAAASDSSEEGDLLSDDSDASVRRRRSSRITRPAVSSRRRSRKRMSILTNQYYDVPRIDDTAPQIYGCVSPAADDAGARRAGASGKRRFFQSAARWDPVGERVLVEWDGMRAPPMSGVSDEMLARFRDTWGNGSKWTVGGVGERTWESGEEDGDMDETGIDDEEAQEMDIDEEEHERDAEDDG